MKQSAKLNKNPYPILTSSKLSTQGSEMKQKSKTPTKRTLINISQNKQNRSRSNSQNKVTFQSTSQNRISEDISDGQYKRKNILKKHNPKWEAYSKQCSIDPQILKDFDQSMNAYYSTLNQFQIDGASSIATFNPTFNTHSLFAQEKNKLHQSLNSQNILQPQIPSKLHTPQQNQKESNKVNFDKMSQRNQGIIFKEWGYCQTIGKWEKKNVSPNKQIERITIESSPQQNRSMLRGNSQRQRDFTSQISALPGSQTQRIIQEQFLTPEQKKINLISGAYILKQKNDESRSKSRNQNDSSSMSAILTTPKNGNSMEYNQKTSQSNLFSKYLKQQQESKYIKENQYVSSYKQEFTMKTNQSDIIQQEKLIRKREEISEKKQNKLIQEEEKQFQTICQVNTTSINKQKSNNILTQNSLSTYNLKQNTNNNTDQNTPSKYFQYKTSKNMRRDQSDIQIQENQENNNSIRCFDYFQIKKTK